MRCLGPKNENGLRGKIEQLNNLESGNHFDAVPISGIREDTIVETVSTTKKKDQRSYFRPVTQKRIRERLCSPCVSESRRHIMYNIFDAL